MRLSDFKDWYTKRIVVVLGGGPSWVRDVTTSPLTPPLKGEMDRNPIPLGVNHHALKVGIRPD